MPINARASAQQHTITYLRIRNIVPSCYEKEYKFNIVVRPEQFCTILKGNLGLLFAGFYIIYTSIDILA